MVLDSRALCAPPESLNLVSTLVDIPAPKAASLSSLNYLRAPIDRRNDLSILAPSGFATFFYSLWQKSTPLSLAPHDFPSARSSRTKPLAYSLGADRPTSARVGMDLRTKLFTNVSSPSADASETSLPRCSTPRNRFLVYPCVFVIINVDSR